MSYNEPKKTGQSTTMTSGCLLFFGLFWLAFSSMFLLIGLGDGGIPFVAFSLLFIAVGLGITGYALMLFWTRFKVGKPTYHISHNTLRVGESFTFQFSHRFPRQVQIQQIRTSLIFRERATYQQGTDTRTVTQDHVIANRVESGGNFQAGQLVGQSYEFTIPRDAMHTVKVRRNELTWLAKFEAEIPGLPNFVEEFELNVLPEMMR